MGTFSFNDRNETQYTEDFLKALKTEIKNLSQLRFTEEELEYMTKNCKMCIRDRECTIRDEASAERYLNNPCDTPPEELLLSLIHILLGTYQITCK